MSKAMDKYKSKLADLSKPRKKGGNHEFVELSEGKNTVRILPGHPNMDGFYVETWSHRKQLSKDKHVTVPCKNQGDTEAGRCPVCDAIENLRNSRDKAKKDLYYSLRAKPRYFANALSRAGASDGEPKIQVLAFGAQILRQLLEIVCDPDEFGDVLDPVDGSDIIIKRTGSGLDTEYTVTPRRQSSPIIPDKPKASKKLVGTSTEDTKLQDLTTMSEVDMDDEKILKLWEGRDDEDEEDEEEEAPKKSKKPSKKVKDEEEEDEDDEEEEAPKKSKKPSKKVKDEEEEDEDDEEDLDAVLRKHTKPAKGKK